MSYIHKESPFKAPSKRAKDFEGMMRALFEALATLMEDLVLLRRSMDDDSVMAVERTEEIAARLEFLGRDLASGLVDLEQAPFDRKTWARLFNTPEEDVPDPVTLFEVPKDEIVLTHPLPDLGDPRNEIFDFENSPGDFYDEDETPVIVLDEPEKLEFIE
jgi:hypothetical protein